MWFSKNMIVCIYLIMINIVGFSIMGIDKKRAKRHQWRIPEKTLFLIAILFGSVGSIAGMYVFRHKTKHPKFVIGMPVILAAQILVCFLVQRFLNNWTK